MPSLRSIAIAGALLAAGLCWACGWRTASVKREMLVGEYVFQMGDRGAPHHDPDRLTLREDGTYVLVRMPAGHPGSTEKGAWQLVHDPDPEIVLGHAGYPVQVRGKRIRLLVNNDLGYWYEKVG